MGLVPRGEPRWDPQGRRPPQVPRSPRQQHPNSPACPQTHQAPAASTLGLRHPASPQGSLPSPCPAQQGAPGAPARDKPAEHPLCNPKSRVVGSHRVPGLFPSIPIPPTRSCLSSSGNLRASDGGSQLIRRLRAHSNTTYTAHRLEIQYCIYYFYCYINAEPER